MKHRVAGRKLGRSSSHRLALLRNLSTELFRAERIRTTLGKAKELRPFAERLLTLSKRETLQARRLVARHIHDRAVVAKIFDTLSARYAARPGGYTRIVKLGPRRGDHAEMALVELVGAEFTAAAEPAPAPAKKKTRKPQAEQPAEREEAAPKPAKKRAAKKPGRAAATEKPTKKATKKTSKKASKKGSGRPASKRGGEKSGS
jgi:large subunit ribosomal protein L17